MNKEDGRRLLREGEKWHLESATEPETIALVPVELEEMGVWISPSEAGVNYFCANHPHSPQLPFFQVLGSKICKWLWVFEKFNEFGFAPNKVVWLIWFGFFLLCNSRSSITNYYDLGLAEAHSHEQENKTSTQDNNI